MSFMNIDEMTPLEAFDWLLETFRMYNRNGLSWIAVRKAMADAEILRTKLHSENDHDTVW
jgi:hypothetical protein